MSMALDFLSQGHHEHCHGMLPSLQQAYHHPPEGSPFQHHNSTSGDELAGDWVTSHDSVHDVLVTRNPMPCSCSSPFPLKKTLCPSFAVILPKFFHLISHSPSMFQLYLSISYVSSWSFPAALSVLVFHMPMVMLSLPRIFDDAPGAYLTPLSWCTAERAVLLDLGGNQSGMVWLCLFSSHGESWEKNILTEPILLQVEHVAVEFIVESFRPSGPCLRPMKISAQ